MILNLACGENRISGAVNVDKFTECDIRADIFNLPFEKDSADLVYLFHTIEHIKETEHYLVLDQIWKVLKPSGRLIITYPEFSKCALNYINNWKGARDFFKMTIFGRQSHPGDYHISLMDSTFFVPYLKQCGFENVVVSEEIGEPYNTVVKCQKGPKLLSKEEFYKKVLWGL